MEKGEEGNTSHGDSHGKLFIDGDGQAESKDGSGDRNFHREKGDSEHAKDSANEHERDKGQGNSPNRTTAHLSAEDPDAEHRQKVIQTKNRMGKAIAESQCIMASVGKEWGRQNAENEKK
jgi:hypothetical protein